MRQQFIFILSKLVNRNKINVKVLNIQAQTLVKRHLLHQVLGNFRAEMFSVSTFQSSQLTVE